MSMRAFRKTFSSHSAVGFLVTATLMICLVLVSIREGKYVKAFLKRSIDSQKVTGKKSRPMTSQKSVPGLVLASFPTRKPDFFRIFKTVDLEMTLPSLRNSATMRLAPQRRLFVFISMTRSRTSSSVTGRPKGFWRYVHLCVASLRSQARTVFGDTVKILLDLSYYGHRDYECDLGALFLRLSRLPIRCRR